MAVINYQSKENQETVQGKYCNDLPTPSKQSKPSNSLLLLMIWIAVPIIAFWILIAITSRNDNNNALKREMSDQYQTQATK